MSELARIAVEQRELVTVARLGGEVDISNAAMVEARLVAAADGSSGPLIVDLTDAEYLDSAWFPAVERVALALARDGRPLRLVCPPGAPSRRLLEIAGIDRLLPLHSSVQEALEALVTG